MVDGDLVSHADLLPAKDDSHPALFYKEVKYNPAVIHKPKTKKAKKKPKKTQKRNHITAADLMIIG